MHAILPYQLLALAFGIVATGCAMGPSKSKKKSDPAALTAPAPATAGPATSPAAGAAVTDDALLAILKESCHECHGANGSNAGNAGNILDLAGLQERRLLVRGSLEASKLYVRMIDAKQPMPPKGLLPEAQRNVVRDWIMADQKANRAALPYETLYKTVAADFEKQSDKVNTRYFHIANLFNAGANDADLESTRRALSKLLNMLSTSPEIKAPVAIDDLKLVYRVNLREYELDRPETLYTRMLKTIYPKLSSTLRDKWLPDPAERKVTNYYGARFKELFEGKITASPFIDREKHTFRAGLPRARSTQLAKMTQAMREGAQKLAGAKAGAYGEIEAPERDATAACKQSTSVDCSNPMPLMRADWFIAQVTGNLQMRLYYHLSGLDDDTVTLDAALGIDDVEGQLVDNARDFDPKKWPKDPIIRAGFSNSGVSVNHRLVERIGLDYSPGRPLWRAFEFKDKNDHASHDIFDGAAGPIFEISADGEAGFECITLMTPPQTTITKLDGATATVRTLRLLDLGVFYPSALVNGDDPNVVKKLKALKARPEAAVDAKDQAAFDEALASFEEAYGHQDYFNYRHDDFVAAHGALPVRTGVAELGDVRMLRCEAPTRFRTFRHESLEYLFLRPNGLQGFVNVGLAAEHLDYKVPNQRALENKEALLIPAFDRPELLVVGAPLSCLSCHVKGYIEKEDMVREYVEESDHPADVKAKIARVHKPFAELKKQMEADNGVFRKALAATGVSLDEPEPIVGTYRRWAAGLTLTQVAAELDVTPETLQASMKAKRNVGQILRELTISGATMRRNDFERWYYSLMCELHESCIEGQKAYTIPAH